MEPDTCPARASAPFTNAPPMVLRMVLKRLAFAEPSSMRTNAPGPITQAYIRADATLARCDWRADFGGGGYSEPSRYTSIELVSMANCLNLQGAE